MVLRPPVFDFIGTFSGTLDGGGTLSVPANQVRPA